MRALQWADTNCGSAPNWSSERAELQRKLAAHSLSARQPNAEPLYCTCTCRTPTFLSLLSSLRNVQSTWNHHPTCCSDKSISQVAIRLYKVCVVSRDLGLILIGDDLCVREMPALLLRFTSHTETFFFFCF